MSRDKDYCEILRTRLKKVSRQVRPISEHYEDCLKIMVEVLEEVIRDFEIRSRGEG